MSRKGDFINDRYNVGKFIAKGGEAAVYLVTDTKENNEK
jgi:hypothetical protein